MATCVLSALPTKGSPIEPPSVCLLEGVLASIGSVGDAYDNALAETTIGLFKTEAIRPGNPFHPGPFKTIEDIEFAGLGLG